MLDFQNNQINHQYYQLIQQYKEFIHSSFERFSSQSNNQLIKTKDIYQRFLLKSVNIMVIVQTIINLMSEGFSRKQQELNDSARKDIGEDMKALFKDDNYQAHLNQQYDVPLQDPNDEMDDDININNKVQQAEENIQIVLQNISQKLSQRSTIQNKIAGMKNIIEKIASSKIDEKQKSLICQWLIDNRILKRFLNDDTHAQILRKMLPILKFLYDNLLLDDEWIIGFMVSALTYHQQYLKIVQSFCHIVSVQHLNLIFDQLNLHEGLESTNYPQILIAIITAPCFLEEFPKLKHKERIHNQQPNDPSADIFEALLAQQQQNEGYLQTQMDAQQNAVHENVRNLTINIFSSLIKGLDISLQVYSPILNKLIASKYSIITQLLNSTIINLFKLGKIHYLWVLDYCLSVDFSQSNESQKGQKNTLKIAFIQKLVNEGLYEFTIASLARNRFNKQIVDKILTIFLVLGKSFNPLEKKYIQLIWKILGLNFREEREKEQFFIFVKQSLKYESAFTQQSIQYIYFNVLLGINSSWFTLRIYECFETIFLRLNEDIQLLYYNPLTRNYQICESELIGLQKFWEIYFQSVDQRVCLKSKQFIWKLSCYASQSKNLIQNQFSTISCEKVLNFLKSSEENSNQFSIQLFYRCFNIIDRLITENTGQNSRTRKRTEIIKLIMKNEVRQSSAPTIFEWKVSLKYTLLELRKRIHKAIKLSNFYLLHQENLLSGEKLTMKQLGLSSGSTIVILNEAQISQSFNQQLFYMNPVENPQNQNNQQKCRQIKQIFGDNFQDDFINFVISKAEGKDMDTLISHFFDESIVTKLHQDYFKTKQQKGQSLQIVEEPNQIQAQQLIPQNIQNEEQIVKNQDSQIKQMKFGQILVSRIQNLKILMEISQKYSYQRGWQTIRRLPLSKDIKLEIQQLIKQNSWDRIFQRDESLAIYNIYNAHLVKLQLIKINSMQKQEKQIFHQRIKNGYSYMINWLSEDLLAGANDILLTEICEIILLEIRKNLKFKVLREYEKLNWIFDNYSLRGSMFKQFMEQSLKDHWLPIDQQNQDDELWQPVSSLSAADRAHLLNIMDKQFIEKVFKIITRTNQFQAPVSQHLLAQIYFFYIVSSEKHYEMVLQLESEDLYTFIKVHGSFAEYMILLSLSLSIQNNIQVRSYEIMTEKLSKIIFEFIHLDQETENQGFVYDTLANLLSYNPDQSSIISQKLISKLINFILEKSSANSAIYAAFLFQLIKICLQNCEKDKQFQLQENKIFGNIKEFVIWILEQYLFQIQNPHVHIRDNSIRQYCYEILCYIIFSDRLGTDLKKIILQFLERLQLKARDTVLDEEHADFKVGKFLGLANLGATCYINSLLQQLYHTKFSKLLIQEQINERTPEYQQQIQLIRMKELKLIFMKLHCSFKNQINPRNFINSIHFYGEPIITTVQQDASQFLLCIFDYIEQLGYQSEVYDVFGGNLCNQIVAHENGQVFTKNNLQHFNTLTIDIKDKKNLQEALAYFVKPQSLDGDNMYYCEELGKKTKAIKRTFIKNMPNILILTLKRFQFDYQSNARQKLNDYFQFPLQLDMNKYSMDYHEGKEEVTNCKYRLVGIVVHSGSAESGHYYSFIKIGEKWFQFNDRVVSEFNIAASLKNQCFGCSEGKKTRSAYIIFYEKINSDYHGSRLDQISVNNSIKKIILKENAEFLKSRLIYDDCFINFVSKIYQLNQSESLRSLLNLISLKQSAFKRVSSNNLADGVYQMKQISEVPKYKDEIDDIFNNDI